MSPCGKMLCGVKDKTNIMRHMQHSIFFCLLGKSSFLHLLKSSMSENRYVAFLYLEHKNLSGLALDQT